MVCPRCGEDTSVIETVSYPRRVRRRRECVSCGTRFTTHERPAEDAPAPDIEVPRATADSIETKKVEREADNE